MTHSNWISRRARWVVVLVALATALSTLGSVALASDIPDASAGTDGTYTTVDANCTQVDNPDVTGDVPLPAPPLPNPNGINCPDDPDAKYVINATAEVGTAGGGAGTEAFIQCMWDLVDINRPFLGNSQDPEGAGAEASWPVLTPNSVKVGQLNDIWSAGRVANPAAGPFVASTTNNVTYYMDYAWRDLSITPGPGIDQYWYDDVREDVGGVPDPLPPCTVAQNSIFAEQTDNSTNVIQVYANAGDATGPGVDGVFGTLDDDNNNNSGVTGFQGAGDPRPGDPNDPEYSWPGNPIGERVIELWAAVDGPDGNVNNISQVYWDVKHPDGSKKVQVHDQIGIGNLECQAGYNNHLGAGLSNPADPTSFGIKHPNTVFGAAVGTDQMSKDAAGAIWDLCAQNDKKLYRDHFTLSKHQPCGSYEVKATSVATSGVLDVMTNFFTVLCFIHLDLDFKAVDYTPGGTTLSPNDQTQVDGDNTLNTNPVGNRPTAINVGSGALNVIVDFYKLTDANSKHITEFDLQFGLSPAALEVGCHPGTGAGTAVACNPVITTDTVGNPTRVNLPETANSTLCTNETGKFIFSIHTNNATPGEYAGTIDILAKHADQTICNNTKDNMQNMTQGVWGGYHKLGPNLAANGGTFAQEPANLPLFDDDYGRNQRSVVNP